MARGFGKTIVRREYASWGEFIDAVKENADKLPERHKEGDEWHQGNDRDLWLGDGSFDETLRYAEGEGWQGAIPAAERLVAHIETDLGFAMVNDFVTTFDVAGSEVDMGRYMAGEPECMSESMPMKVMRTGRVIKIAVPVCYSSMINAETVKARGAAVMALVNAFAMMQHPVEIYACLAIHGSGNYQREDGTRGDPRLSYVIKVQDADQPLNMGRVMYALAHPTMLRQLIFALEHQENDDVIWKFSIGSGYGHAPYGATIDDLNINIENAIILPELRSNSGWSEEESVAWIKEQLNRIKEG